MAQFASTLNGFCRLGIALLLSLCVAGGCGEPDNSAQTASGQKKSPQELRIASLSPAMTTFVIDLGLGDHLVGSTPFCRGLEGPTPIVGSLSGVDAEVLLRVKPSVVLLQPGVGGADPALLGLAQRNDFAIVQQRLDSLADVEAAIRAIGSACQEGDGSEELEGLCREISLLQSAPRDSGPRCVLLYSVEPLGAAGEGTYLDEILCAAGAQNALSSQGWLELSAEELIALAPDVVIVFAASSPKGLEALPWSRRPRIVHVDSPDALEPSSRAPAIAEELREALGVQES